MTQASCRDAALTLPALGTADAFPDCAPSTGPLSADLRSEPDVANSPDSHVGAKDEGTPSHGLGKGGCKVVICPRHTQGGDRLHTVGGAWPHPGEKKSRKQ